MSAVLRLITLPLRAPMLLVLVAVSVYEGLHWTSPAPGAMTELLGLPMVVWSLDCLHALVVVFVCTMPDLLLQWVSNVMAASRVMSLVITLLIVTVGGLYLLHLNVLSNVLILASAVLLARLDLARIRVNPPPLRQAVLLGLLVMVSANIGHWASS
jgi:hypothetical protein